MLHLLEKRYRLLALFALLLSQTSQAQVERYLEGVHYTLLPDTTYAQQLATAPGMTEVLEVFWYGCGSCNAFDPLLNKWAADAAGTVSFRRSPIIWNSMTRQHARLFFTTQSLDLHEQMHATIFSEIHEQANHLADEDSMATLFRQHGVAAADFEKHFNSFSVDSHLRKAETLARDLAVPAVPALVVAGKYRVNLGKAVPGYQDMLDVAGFLVHREQQLRND